MERCGLKLRAAVPNGPIKASYFKIHLTDIYFSATLFDFWEVHEPGLEAPSITFDRVEAGYGPVDARAVELSNTGKAGATIESVRLDSDEAFGIVEQGAQSIDAGDVDRSWKLAPKPVFLRGRTGPCFASPVFLLERPCTFASVMEPPSARYRPNLMCPMP